MDGVTLVDQARRAGLTVAVEGDRLRIVGPCAADGLARQLLANKAAVLAELRRRGVIALFPYSPDHSDGSIPSDFMEIPWPIDIDPLHTGRLTGKVPPGWSRDGWIMVTRDRMTRTNDPELLRLLQAELDAIEAVETETEAAAIRAADQKTEKG